MVALMTEALKLSGGEKVLEIGTGSGYQTAMLAELAGQVVSIERYRAAFRARRRGAAAIGLRQRDADRRRRHAGLARAVRLTTASW